MHDQILPVVAAEFWGGKDQRADVEPSSNNSIRRKGSQRKWNHKISVTYESIIGMGHTIVESDNGVLAQGLCEITQYHLEDTSIDYAAVSNFLLTWLPQKQKSPSK